jgi:hypothetical protein
VEGIDFDIWDLPKHAATAPVTVLLLVPPVLFVGLANLLTLQ